MANKDALGQLIICLYGDCLVYVQEYLHVQERESGRLPALGAPTVVPHATVACRGRFFYLLTGVLTRPDQETKRYKRQRV